MKRNIRKELEIKEAFDKLIAVRKLMQNENVVPVEVPKMEVIVNYPATILNVGREKTVVKVRDEDFDIEKGIAMAILKYCGFKRSMMKDLIDNANIQRTKRGKK